MKTVDLIELVVRVGDTVSYNTKFLMSNQLKEDDNWMRAWEATGEVTRLEHNIASIRWDNLNGKASTEPGCVMVNRLYVIEKREERERDEKAS